MKPITKKAIEAARRAAELQAALWDQVCIIEGELDTKLLASDFEDLATMVDTPNPNNPSTSVRAARKHLKHLLEGKRS